MPPCKSLAFAISLAVLVQSDAFAQSQETQRKERQNTKPRGREPVKVVDIAPETATHVEVEPLNIKFKRLTALRITRDNSLLAADADAKLIRMINPAGEQVDTVELPFAPEALEITGGGAIYCGGEGTLAKLNADGRIVLMENVPDDVAPDAAESPKGNETGKPQSPRRRRKPRPKRVSGIAVTDRDVFVAFGSGWSTSSKSKLYRFDLELKNPQLLAEGLRGCCQRCDIKSRDGVLFLAENAAHRVVQYDRDGNVLQKWGERGRNNLPTFGACCNPMNICFDGHGVMYTAESGLGRIKRYTTEGEFLGLVGYVGTERFWHGSGLAASCSNMAVAVTSDGQRVYVMDFKNGQIRVLQMKTAE